MAATYKDLNFDEGDDFPYVVTVIDGDSAAVDLTGYTFYMTVKEKLSDSDDQAIFKKTVTSIPSPTLGIVTITIDRADTQNKTPGIYPYDIKYKSDTSTVRTLLYGKFKMTQAITDSVA